MSEYYEGYDIDYDKAVSMIKNFEDYNCLIRDLNYIDLCTDGMGTYIINLINNFIRTSSDFYKFFGKSEWADVWLARYDKKNICYFDKELGMEFKFLDKHHSCWPRINIEGVIKRMKREVDGFVYCGLSYMEPLSENFKSFLKDTINNFSNVKQITLIKEEINQDAWEDYCLILGYNPDETDSIEVEIKSSKDV